MELFWKYLKIFLHFKIRKSFFSSFWRLNRGLAGKEGGLVEGFTDFAENENNGTLKSFIIPFIPSTSSVSFFALSG